MRDNIINQTLKTFKRMFPLKADEGETMKLYKIEEILRPEPEAQIDIAIMADGRRICETTLDVFADHVRGDSSVGEATGWVIHRLMLGKKDVTNEMDLTGIQQHLGEIL